MGSMGTDERAGLSGAEKTKKQILNPNHITTPPSRMPCPPASVEPFTTIGRHR